MADDAARTFAFERDFLASMRCIPMAVRMKLDLAGVKLSLKEWSQLSTGDRDALLAAPIDADAFNALARDLVVARCGREPAVMPRAVLEPWMGPGDVCPDGVVDLARAEGVALTADAWKRLTPLERFALVKLSRPSHENPNFVRALRELSLA